MKKLSLLLFIAVIAAASCKKEDKCPFVDGSFSAPANERNYLKGYLASHTPPPVEDSTGVFYNVVSPGTGATPNICSRLAVRYKGTYIPSGISFDSTVANGTASFQLGRVIAGWQKGLPKVKEGGKITLYIPPSLAYGPNDYYDNGVLVMPGNSYLKFDIELVDVQ
ncbi:MAG: hypothetical protein EOP53_24375 [Sphingobacteriales bacterium]|nr:MAG: hypothetical protein EOP53_24375 [Sphingobacteriales bacterium]